MVISKVYHGGSPLKSYYSFFSSGSGTGDELVKVSAADVAADYLDGKLVAGTNVTITLLNPGGVETLEIAAASGVADEKVKVTGTDTTEGFLFNKIAVSELTITILNPGGNEIMLISQINIGKIFASSTDTGSLGFLDDKLAAGTGVVLTLLNPGGSEEVEVNVPDTGKVLVTAGDTDIDYLKNSVEDGEGILVVVTNPGGAEKLDIRSLGQSNVSSLDTTIAYLEDKLIAQSPIVVTKLNPAGNEQIEISADGTVDQLVKVSALDTTANYLFDKAVAGDGTTTEVLNPSGDEALRINATGEVRCTAADTDYQYLLASLAAGSNITLTLLNPGGNETVEIESSGGSGSERHTIIFSSFSSMAVGTLIEGPQSGSWTAVGQGYYTGKNVLLRELNALVNAYNSFSVGSVAFELRRVPADQVAVVTGASGVAVNSVSVPLLNAGGSQRFYPGASNTGLSDIIPTGSLIFCRCSFFDASSVNGVTLQVILEDQ